MVIAAFIVSVVSVIVAVAALCLSARGTRAAERSAAAAEVSARSSQESATAATRSADVDEQTLELERRKADTEARREREAAAPRFEPVRSAGAGSSPGAFNLHSVQPRFGAHLRNVGGSAAVIERVLLSYSGGNANGALQLESDAAAGEQPPPTRVPPSEKVTIVFENAEIEALRTSTEPLRLELSFTSQIGDRRQVLVLGRMPADGIRRLQWRVLSEE